MKVGSSVKVKHNKDVDSKYWDKTGTVTANADAGELVEVQFDEEVVSRFFDASDLQVL